MVWSLVINSLWPSDALWCSRSLPTLIQVMAWSLLGTTPSSERMLTYCQFEPSEINFSKIWIKIQHISFKKMYFKMSAMVAIFILVPNDLHIEFLIICVMNILISNHWVTEAQVHEISNSIPRSAPVFLVIHIVVMFISCGDKQRWIILILVMIGFDIYTMLIQVLPHQVRAEHWGLNKMAASLANNIFRYIFLNEIICILTGISLNFVTRAQFLVDDKWPSVQVMPWCWTGNKPLPEPIMVKFYHALWHHKTTIPVMAWCHTADNPLPEPM